MNNIDSDFLAISDNLKSFYIYELLSDSEKILLENNSINIVRINNIGYYTFNVVTNSKNTILTSEEDKTRLGLFNSFELSTTQKIPLKESTFYVLSETEINTTEELNNSYYFESKLEENLFNEVTEQSAVTFTASRLKSFKELNKISFVLNKDDNNKYNQLTLKLPKTALINNLIFTARNEENESYRIKPNLLSNNPPYLLFCNPINIIDNKLSLYPWTFNPIRWISYAVIKEVSEQQEDKSYRVDLFRLFTILEIIEFKDVYWQLFAVSDAVNSGYKGMDKEEKEKWQQEYGQFNKASEYIDYEVFKILSSYKKQNQIQAVKSIMLLSSSQLSGQYCYKGGNTQEHKTIFPFYIEKIGVDFYIKSDIYKLEEHLKPLLTNAFLNANAFIVNDQMVQLPLLPEKLQELDYSQNPTDFNEKTLNLDYPFWIQLIGEKAQSNFLFLGDAKSKTQRRFMYETYTVSGSVTDSSFAVRREFQTKDILKWKIERVGGTVKDIRCKSLGSYTIEINEPYTGGPHTGTTTELIYKYQCVGIYEIDKPKFVYFDEQPDLYFYNKNDLAKIIDPDNLAETISYDFAFDLNEGERLESLLISSVWTDWVELDFKNGNSIKLRTSNYENQTHARTKINIW
ncbi:hypothetical protein [Mycoplasma buteonis]|uniref:hypothetical protein n=1 Tax=Mycoplasma buteonis TaxID=171280 RepID=UPI00055B72F2|nr:hypothetical protein [Mycoplasma buteonis]